MIIYIQPVAKPRMTRSDKWKKRKVVLKYWNFKDHLKAQAQKENFILSSDISIYFEIKTPKSWSKKKTNKMLFQAHQQKPDIDNLVKAVLDSLADDDSYISALKVHKIWSDEGKITIINN